MTVSKRLRYEILRRDNHACRYCGRAAPAVALTVDHVLPVALGGLSEPGNLVAACVDCNAGKSSSTPDAIVVQQVSDDAIRWARAVAQAVADSAANASRHDVDNAEFDELWTLYCGSFNRDSRPLDWAEQLNGCRAQGLDQRAILAALGAAEGAKHVAQRDKWRYFRGVCRAKVAELHDAAHEILAVERTEDVR